ncbi:MAG TPA: TraR/DksA C4-type zinc finger protein [Candidatus Binataceae bacterium]|jgi:DnaK suppressor protein
MNRSTQVTMTKPNMYKGRGEFIAKSREHLERMRVALIHELASDMRATRSPGGNGSMDSADLASMELEQRMAVVLSARERDRIIEIDRALERIDQGNYGVCAACGFEITEPRLQAMPFTRHCRDCQQDQEREAKTRYRGNDIASERSNDFASNLPVEEINRESMKR